MQVRNRLPRQPAIKLTVPSTGSAPVAKSTPGKVSKPAAVQPGAALYERMEEMNKASTVRPQPPRLSSPPLLPFPQLPRHWVLGSWTEGNCGPTHGAYSHHGKRQMPGSPVILLLPPCLLTQDTP
jgi:hypothetical protein